MIATHDAISILTSYTKYLYRTAKERLMSTAAERVMVYKPYTLDGIPTAMTLACMQNGTLSDLHLIELTCPCGHSWGLCEPDALRFHYTHCPHAKRTP